MSSACNSGSSEDVVEADDFFTDDLDDDEDEEDEDEDEDEEEDLDSLVVLSESAAEASVATEESFFEELFIDDFLACGGRRDGRGQVE